MDQLDGLKKVLELAKQLVEDRKEAPAQFPAVNELLNNPNGVARCHSD